MRHSVGLVIVLVASGLPPLRAAEAGASSDGGNALSAVVAKALPRVVKIYGAGIGRTRDFGSGVLVSADGKVVTVLSLMLDTSNLRVVTADGTRYQATVVRRDEVRQLALLQLDMKAAHGEAAPPLPFFAASTSDGIAPGDWVAAVANPFKVATGDEPVSVQLGVLSTRTTLDARRYRQDYPYEGEVLVVDAITSNPGSAGGALVTLDGEWIGLIGRIAQSNLTGTRLNYALPVEVVGAFLRDDPPAAPTTQPRPAAARGPGHHGIKLFELGFRRKLVYVDRVQRGSPAATAGLRRDDLIVSVDGKSVPRVRVFRKLMSARQAGDQVTLVIKRGKKIETVKLTLGPRP